MDGKPEEPQATPEPEGEGEDYIRITSPEDIPTLEPPEPLEFKWKPAGFKKPIGILVELRWPEDVEEFQQAIQEAMLNHREAMANWKRAGKKPTEKPGAIWGHYKLIRQTLIAKPTWLHAEAGVANIPPPVLWQFHAALMERGVRGTDFQVDSGLRTNALEELKALLSTFDSEDGSEPSPETSKSEQPSKSESSSTPPSEPSSDENGSNESETPST